MYLLQAVLQNGGLIPPMHLQRAAALPQMMPTDDVIPPQSYQYVNHYNDFVLG